MKIAKKKEQEFIQMFEGFSDALFRHCFFRVSNREVAIDLVQEGFTKTWLHISKGNEILNLKAFLYQVMNNLIIDYYRKHKSDSLDALIEDGYDPISSGQEEIVSHAEIREIKEILGGIPEKDRDVIVLRHIEGFSVKEIAETLGETENAVSVRLHRALEKVRQILNP